MAHVTVPSTEPEITYEVTSAQSVFTIPAYIVFWQESDLRLFSEVAGVYTEIAASAWSFTGTYDGGYAGGELTLATAVSSCNLHLYRSTTLGRSTDFVEGAPIARAVLNTQIDQLAAADVDAYWRNERTVRVPDYYPPIDPITDPDNIVVSFSQRGLFDVATYGGALNGVDDDLGALTAAIAAAQAAGGGTVTWNGYLRLNSGYVPSGAFAHITLAPKGGGYLYNPDHGFDVLTLGSTQADWRLDNVKFLFDNAPTGGTERWLVNAACDSLITENLYGLRNWSGIKLTGPKFKLLGETYLQDMRTALGRGLMVQQPASPTTEVGFVERLVCNAAAGSEYLYAAHIISAYGIYLKGEGYKAQIPLRIEPGVGETIATMTIDWASDTSTGRGVSMVGAGNIYRLEGFIRSSSNGDIGVYIGNAPQSADLHIRTVDNASHGFFAEALNFREGRYNIVSYGNGATGATFSAGASRFHVDFVGGDGDAFGNNTGVGLVIGAGCTDFTRTARGAGGSGGFLTDASSVVAVASATNMTLPSQGDLFSITGTTTIATLLGGYIGREVTLIFAASVTVTHSIGANGMKLAGNVNLSAAANTVLRLKHNGAQFFETGRAP